MSAYAVELAQALRRNELRLDHARVEILVDGVARQSGLSRNLAARKLLSQRHPANDIQKSHADHSLAPRHSMHWAEGHMGQISMEIMTTSGSRLGGNQQLIISWLRKGLSHPYRQHSTAGLSQGPHGPWNTAALVPRPRWQILLTLVSAIPALQGILAGIYHCPMVARIRFPSLIQVFDPRV